MLTIEEVMPKEQILKDTDRVISFNFIYDIVKALYSSDNRCPSIDVVVLFEIIFIKYLFSIRSIRKIIKKSK